MRTGNKLFILAAFILSGIIVLSIINTYIDPADKSDTVLKVTRDEQHVTDMKNGADPDIGVTTISSDHMVDKSFETHLPLVVIDIGDKELPVTKTFEKQPDGDVIVKRTDEERFVNGEMEIIDNPDYDNHLSDKAAIKSDIRIRYRGESSLGYDKKQYAIKLINNNDSSRKLSVMSMKENNDWILNVSMIDASLIRNYMAYDLGSSMFPYTPEAKFCEVIFRNGDDYSYQGVYLMMEKIEEGKDRVPLSNYEKGDRLVSYLLKRDREDKSKRQLSTYCSRNDLCYGRISVLYPEDDEIDDEAFNYIEDDIDSIERILYSKDQDEFEKWPDYIDKDSFVDYFLINELFGNYDAGNNSTYYYKNKNGKLHVGPLWDYDGAMDNYSTELNNPENIAFNGQPYFKQLCRSKYYVDELNERYAEMQSSIFGTEYINSYIDSVSEFLGNAALRDWSRWSDQYGENSMLKTISDNSGIEIDRKRDSYEDEVQRLKDYFSMKEKYMGTDLKKLEDGTEDTRTSTGSEAAVIMIILLLCAVVLIRRRESFK